MSDLPPRVEVFVSAEQRAKVLGLYEQGLYLQAYRLAEAIGPIQHWRGPEARILAGRLAGNLGSMRLADWHFVHAWRGNRKHAEALWFFARYLMAARGPLAAWHFVQGHPFPDDAPLVLRSHWCSQQAAILAQLRDFDAAEDWLKRAEAIGVEPWTCLEWAGLFSLADRHDDAEAAARRALQLRPWYRPAVQWVAHFLVQKERDAEAIELLTEATKRLESGAVWGQLAALQIELKRYDEAERSLDELERLSPLLYKREKEWLTARRCDLACRKGEHAQALAMARTIKGKHFENLVQRLTNRVEPTRRVELAVPFVRQHHKTCGPATLTSIARFWSMPADHVEVSEEIAYLGTPYHSERKWADEHGWFTRAFTVTWEAAVALIDRGIPFTLATLDVSSGHLQAVIGYDSAARTFIVRDPGDRHQVEMSYDLMKERYSASGPRGIAMVPLKDKDRLADLRLPDEELYDLVYQCDLARVNHRRAEAEQAFQAMVAKAPGHYLTLSVKRELANYDADSPAGLAATDELLTLFPGDPFLELVRADYLRSLGKRDERLAIYQRLSEPKDADPACWLYYAQELSADARDDVKTTYLLKRAIRKTPAQAPLHGRLLDTLARIRWSQRRFDEALRLSYFATCGEDKDEFISLNYFHYARARGEADRVLELMQNRFRRFGAQSSHPGRTLYSALVQLERMGEAFDVLDEAMRLRPQDGELLTYAAEAHIYKGEFDRAADILARADGVSRPAARLRTVARLATAQGDLLKARDAWEEVIKLEPLAEDAHRGYLQLLADRDGRLAALDHLATYCQRYPNHFGLARLRYDWAFHDGPAAREPMMKRLIECHPTDVPSRCEYAFLLTEQARLDEALAQIDDAEPIDPHSAAVWNARGFVLRLKNQPEDSRHAYREAIRLFVDFEVAIHELIFQCENLQERRDAVAFVEKELVRQSTFGGGLLALHRAAQPVMPPDELLGCLRRVLDNRHDLWQAWDVVIRQLVYLERGDEALALAQKAVQRYPLLAGLWLDLADAHRLSRNSEHEITSIQRALQLAPNWTDALRMLVDAQERGGAVDDARRALEHAITQAPLIGIHYLVHAEFLWRRGEHDQAIKQARQSLVLDFWLDLAWNTLAGWCMALDRGDEAIELAREWTRKRPGEARSWLRLAQAYQWQNPRANSSDERARIDQCVAAYDEALQRNFQARDIHDMKAEMLGLFGRFDEARKACQPPGWKGKLPAEFRRRAAWVTAQEGEFAKAKEQMVAALKDDRTHQWGWTQLVDWCYATQQFREYLDAANDMLRARPQSALAMTYRGEARVRMDEREAGLDDLRSAFRKDPCNALAGFLLFDEQMVDDNLVGAESTLLSLQQNLVGEFVKARQIQFQAKKENQTIALEKFKELCASRSLNTQPLDMAMRALDVAGWKEQGEQLIKEAMREPSWNLHLAVLYASRWNPNLANDLPDRIAVLDKALDIQPGTFRFLDLKADLLTAGAQFDRAWQVCQEKTFAADKFALDGRCAWVMYCSGRQAEAIDWMRDILKQYPKYLWGWAQLADWYSRAGRWVDVLTVAEQLVMLAPRDPVGFGWRGLAKHNLGDAQAARADYLHGLDLQPWYIWGAWQLWGLYVQNQEWQRAEKLLEKVQKYADKGEWAQRKVDMLVYLNRKSAFAKEFESLLKHSQKTPWLIDQSLQFLIQVGWWSDAEEVMHRNLDLGAHVCDPWVRLRVAMGDRRVGADVQNMSASRPERTNCIAAYAVELAYAKDPHGLRAWILEHEDALREDTPCWGKVGAALYVVQDWRGAIEWLSDWSDHPKALPAMLLPLTKALRILGRVEEARKVSLHCLTKLNGDYASSFHKVWLMYDQAMDGELLPVQRYLEQADLGGFDGYHQMIAAMVRGLSYMMSDKENGFARAREVLARTAKYAPPTVHDPALTQAYQKCVSQMAAQRGTFAAKLWRWWRWLMPALPQVPKAPG